MTVLAAAVCFVVCHPGPADHFAAFADQIPDVQILASSSIAGKFQGYNVEVLDEPLCLDTVVAKCAGMHIVMTDVGDPQCADLHNALRERHPHIWRFAYYDNPEAQGSAEYFRVAQNVMQAAQKVLFANANLAKDPQRHIGIGYYPAYQKSEKIAAERAQGGLLRRWFLEEHGLDDKPIVVYFGGCNQEYFTQSFPAFLRLLAQIDLSEVHVVLQQHPRAAHEKYERNLLRTWSEETGKTLLISSWSSDSMQILANYALYTQTSMAPFFALAGIPVSPVAHEQPSTPDLLVQSGIPCITSAQELSFALAAPKVPQESTMQAIRDGLGIREDWAERIKRALTYEPAGE